MFDRICMAAPQWALDATQASQAAILRILDEQEGRKGAD
jgi:hypothetical protein